MFNVSFGNACFSPDGRLIATAQGIRVMIRDSSSFDVMHVFPCVDKIDRIEFSPDSRLILCAMYGRCSVQAFNMEEPDWRCRVNENIAGLTYATWTPDSTHILTASDFGIHISIWSLINKNTYNVSFHKEGPHMHSFSDCGRFDMFYILLLIKILINI